MPGPKARERYRIGGTGPGNTIILSEVRGFEALEGRRSTLAGELPCEARAAHLIGWINNLGGQIGGGRCALLEHVTAKGAERDEVEC